MAPDVSQQISHAARRAGLRQADGPSLDALAERRAQLWAVVFFVCTSLGIAVVMLSVPTDDDTLRDQLVGLPGFRAGVLLLLVGLAGYVLEKERYLRRLHGLLLDERLGRERESARAQALLDADRLKSEFVSRVDFELSRLLGSALDTVRGGHPVCATDRPLVTMLESRIERSATQLRELVSEHDAGILDIARDQWRPVA